MKLLHTSDWHLGQTLMRRKRYEEFEALLHWLADTVRQHDIDVLLVAGDIFDGSSPSNRAQEMYYRFLWQMAASCCRHVVIIAGNHDSPAFLAAPKELLKALHIHVVGSAAATPEGEVLLLRNEQGAPELIVCAVPYLRDKDIRVAEAGESIEDKERKLVAGIRDHYAAVAALAEQKRRELGANIPIVGMGHLFAAGGQCGGDDGMRELYVGSLAHVAAGSLPSCFDYLALGHLHAPQKAGGSETARYSGSPLALGFGEAKQQKSMCLVAFRGAAPSVELLPVPVFQELERIKGDWDGIARRILELSAAGSQGWLEVIFDGDEVIGDLSERLESAISGTGMEILVTRNNRSIARALGQIHEAENLADLDARDVFERCLAAHEVPEDQRPELISAYRETLVSLYEDGSA